MIKEMFEKVEHEAGVNNMTVCGYVCLPAAVIMSLVSLIVVIAVFALTDSETATNVSTAAMGIDMLVGFTGIIAEVWDRISCLF